MKAGTLLFILGDVIALLASRGILTTAGDFDNTKLDTAAEDVQLVSDIDAILVKHGVVIPGKAQQIIQLLPLLVGFIR